MSWLDFNEESAADLREAASEAGFDVSPEQLRRWTRRGLLPLVGREGHGRGQGGSTMWFKKGASEHLLRLLELKSEKDDLNWVGWHLWLSGYPVERFVADALPQLFRTKADSAKAELESYLRGDPDNVINRSRGRRPAGLLEATRDEVGRQHIAKVGEFIFRLAINELTADLFERSPGVAEILSRGEPQDLRWDTPDEEKCLREFSEEVAELVDLEANYRTAKRVQDANKVGHAWLLKIWKESLIGWRECLGPSADSRSFMPRWFFCFWFAVRMRDTELGNLVEYTAGQFARSYLTP